jgi:UDP-sulfoquinovose synthase
MKIMILGGDGYLGWPTACYLSKRGHQILSVDNFSKRKIENENGINSILSNLTIQDKINNWNKNNDNNIIFEMCDLLNHRSIYKKLEKFKPEVIIHYAEQPSAPYSMKDRSSAYFTQMNNVMGNLNLLFGIKKYCPTAHLIKLGTMGEYGTPNIDIEEGWLEINHNGRKDRLLFPKKPGSFYHLSKVHDTNNIEFACRLWNLRCTDLNQGVVYGNETDELKEYPDEMGVSFHYDDIFGTVINRFISQAVTTKQLTVYGKGLQKRAFLNINDTLRCVDLSLNNPAEIGEFRVFNQFTETFSINDLAKIVQKASKDLGNDIEVINLENPRLEQVEHYYNPKNSGLISLGLKPIPFDNLLAKNMIKKLENYKEKIDINKFLPSLKWKN